VKLFAKDPFEKKQLQIAHKAGGEVVPNTPFLMGL